MVDPSPVRRHALILGVGSLLVLTVSAGCLGNPMHRGGQLTVCEVDAVPANASVIPATNTTVWGAEALIEAVITVVETDRTSVERRFEPHKQAALEAFDAVAGPAVDTASNCGMAPGNLYVRYGGEVVAVSIRYLA